MTRHPVRRGPARFLCAAAALLLALPAAAQEQPAPAPRVEVAGRVSAGRADFTGRVVDASTGAPLSEAVVRLPGLYREVVTDSTGRFLVPRVPAGEHRVVVTRLGYADLRQSLEAGRESEVALMPQPLVLERIDVVHDALEARRRRIPYAVRTMERDELLRTRMFSARLLLPQLGVDVMRCRGGRSCIWRHGKYARPAVTIDDRPAVGGIDDLDMYDPQELYAVETIQGGTYINVYTVAYIERLARSGREPWPLIY